MTSGLLLAYIEITDGVHVGGGSRQAALRLVPSAAKTEQAYAPNMITPDLACFRLRVEADLVTWFS
jgi:hypothetical protein